MTGTGRRSVEKPPLNAAKNMIIVTVQSLINGASPKGLALLAASHHQKYHRKLKIFDLTP
eukprot:scaffold11846_cov72-Skeletonema_dohrnii-CCMP3373.AAC.3